MRILVDASVIIAVIADEPHKTSLIGVTAGCDLAAPQSVHWEIGNAFSAMLKRKRVSVGEALEALAIYRKIPIGFLDVELDESLRLAAQLNLYAYDAYIVQCALSHRLPLLSLDRRLTTAAEKVGVKVMEIG